MRRFGVALLLFGIGSALLSLLHREFILLMWISLWGDTVAWIIRGAMVLLGAALIALGQNEGGAAE